jgi:hypothetical protein
MQITINIPALLFPAVSLLLIAYTTRYLAIARLMRDLKQEYEKEHDLVSLKQIVFLKRRERFIRNMQTFAIASIFCCTFSMALIFFEEPRWGGYLFAAALILMLISLAIALRDIATAGGALMIELKEMEEHLKKVEDEEGKKWLRFPND